MLTQQQAVETLNQAFVISRQDSFTTNKNSQFKRFSALSKFNSYFKWLDREGSMKNENVDTDMVLRNC